MESPGTTSPAARRGETDGLRAFFDPRSIAVVGASDRPEKWGYYLSEGALAGASRREVHLVSRAGGEIMGRQAHRSLAELPAAPELVVLAVPAPVLGELVTEAAALGSRAFVAISSEFAEFDDEGRARQEDLVARLRETGARLIGPNCLGIFDTSSDLQAAWIPVGRRGFMPGPLAVVTQSGGVGLDLIVQARHYELGISRFASVGNQADVSIAELLDDVAGHEQTRAVAVYCEDAGDRDAMLAAAGRVVEAGKHVVLMAPGDSAAARRAALAHTGSTVGDPGALRAGCEAIGAHFVTTPEELAQVAQVVLRSARPRGRRVAVISDGGGHAVVAGDLAATAGLDVVPLSDATRARIVDAVAPAAPGNPIDLGGAIDPAMMERAIDVLCDSGEVDGILLVGGYAQWVEMDPPLGELERESALRILARVAEHELPLVVQTYFEFTPTTTAMREAGAAVFRELGVAVDTYARVCLAAEAERPRVELA